MDSGKNSEMTDQEMLEMIDSLPPIPEKIKQSMRETALSSIDPNKVQDVKHLYGEQS